MNADKLYDILKFDEGDEEYPVNKFVKEIADSPFYCGVVRTYDSDVAKGVVSTLMKSGKSTGIHISYEVSKSLVDFPVWIITWEEG